MTNSLKSWGNHLHHLWLACLHSPSCTQWCKYSQNSAFIWELDTDISKDDWCEAPCTLSRRDAIQFWMVLLPVCCCYKSSHCFVLACNSDIYRIYRYDPNDSRHLAFILGHSKSYSRIHRYYHTTDGQPFDLLAYTISYPSHSAS